jgi:hypothetical protein
MTTAAEEIKKAVMKSVAPEESWHKIGRTTYSVGKARVHVRYCGKQVGDHWYNINPTTLRADYELWICGSANHWYLIPMDRIRVMYEHPNAYQDGTHATLKDVTVSLPRHLAIYAAPGVSMNIQQYFKATLSKVPVTPHPASAMAQLHR